MAKDNQLKTLYPIDLEKDPRDEQKLSPDQENKVVYSKFEQAKTGKQSVEAVSQLSQQVKNHTNITSSPYSLHKLQNEVDIFLDLQRKEMQKRFVMADVLEKELESNINIYKQKKEKKAKEKQILEGYEKADAKEKQKLAKEEEAYSFFHQKISTLQRVPTYIEKIVDDFFEKQFERKELEKILNMIIRMDDAGNLREGPMTREEWEIMNNMGTNYVGPQESSNISNADKMVRMQVFGKDLYNLFELNSYLSDENYEKVAKSCLENNEPSLTKNVQI